MQNYMARASTFYREREQNREQQKVEAKNARLLIALALLIILIQAYFVTPY